MNLFQAYCATGFVLCVLGALLFLRNEKFLRALSALPRSRAAGIVLWGGAFLWFVWHLATIPNVDLAGFPRSWLIVLFGGAGLLAFRFLPDLLSLRGLAVLVLFSCNELLYAGFGHLPYSRVLAGTAYILIVGALWVGAAPYVLRNAIERVAGTPFVSRAAGTAILLVGVANLAAGFFWLPADCRVLY